MCKHSIDINVIICGAAHKGNERLFFFYWYYIYVQGLLLITYSLYAQLLILFCQGKTVTYVPYSDYIHNVVRKMQGQLCFHLLRNYNTVIIMIIIISFYQTFDFCKIKTYIIKGFF